VLQKIGQSSELIPGGTANDKSDIRYHLLYETTYHCIYSIITDGRRYVLKGIRPTVQDKARQECLLQREYTILTQLESPFIVRAWELRKDPQVGLCIVMEYIDGQPLDSWLRSKPSLWQRRQILNEILDTIQYLHSKQIIHGDLKPGNILITNSENHIKLLDLGLADKDEFAQTNLGCTKRYAAPEQIKGESIDSRTDIFAMGAIIRLLFPHQYLCIVHKCTRSRKEHRYSSIASLRRAITLRSVLGKLMGVLIAISLLSFVFYRYAQSRILPVDTHSPIMRQDSIRESTTVTRDTVIKIVHQPLAVPAEERRIWQDNTGDSSVVTRDMVAQIVQQQLTISPEERQQRQASFDSAWAVLEAKIKRNQELHEKKLKEDRVVADTISARQERSYQRYKQLYRDDNYPHYLEFTNVIWGFYEADFRKIVGECLKGKDHDVSIRLKIEYQRILYEKKAAGNVFCSLASVYDSPLYETDKEQIDAQLTHLRDSLAAYKADVDSFFSVEDLQQQIQKR